MGFSNKISTLTPSRQRAGLLEKSLLSLGDVHEHLVYVDDDDPELEEYRKLEIPKMKLTVGERHNYWALQNYYNELASQATGDWLMLWNDDCILHAGKDWMDGLSGLDPSRPAVINLHEPGNNWFPLISKGFYKALGHYSQSPHNDSWVMEIANAVGIHHERCDLVEIEHLRDSGLNDETAKNSARIAPETGRVHSGMRAKEMREDIEKLQGVI